MYKHIYDCFKHWYHEDKGTIWIYSDPHFSDEEMPLIRKNYISDEEQVKRINSKVGKNDTIIFLGDIGNIEYIKKIRGYKVLIMGNHDSGYSNYKIDWWSEWKKKWDNENGWIEEQVIKCNYLFDEVYEGPLTISDKIILSHEPINLPFFFNIHGHCHNLPHIYDDNHLNVVAEAIDYTPVKFIDIVKGGKLKNIESIHRITINEATERSKRKKKNFKK